MREVQVSYGQDPLGHWSAKITGAFQAKCEGSSPQEAQQKVDAALTSHGATVELPKKEGQTIVYA